MDKQKGLFDNVEAPAVNFPSDIRNKIPDKVLLRPDEVAAIFEVTVKTVYQWCALGILPSIKIGGVVRIKRSTILQIIDADRDITLE